MCKLDKEIAEQGIMISKGEYLKLKVDSATLSLLNFGGVDNWEWYSDSLYPEDDEEESIDDIEKRLVKEIENMPNVVGYFEQEA